MHIAIIHTQYRIHGGIENYLLNLVDGLLDLGHKITIYCYKRDQRIPQKDNCEVVTKFQWLPRKMRERFFVKFIQSKFNYKNYDLTISLLSAGNPDIYICGGTRKGYLKYTKKKAHP